MVFDISWSGACWTDPRRAPPTANRRVAVTDSSGTVSTAYYSNSQVLSVTDQNGAGHTTTYTYDPENRKQTETNPVGEVTTTVYYQNGLILQSMAPPDNVTSYTYDAANRQLTVSDPTNIVTQSAYFSNGQLQTSTAPAGTTTYLYDHANRPTGDTNPRTFSTNTVYFCQSAGDRRIKTSRGSALQNRPAMICIDDDGVIWVWQGFGGLCSRDRGGNWLARGSCALAAS